MSQVISILSGYDVYEVTFSGTLILSIRKFYQGGLIRVVGFNNLPQDVKDKIIKAIRKHVKATETTRADKAAGIVNGARYDVQDVRRDREPGV